MCRGWKVSEYLCVLGRLASGPFPVPYSMPLANAQTSEPEGLSPVLWNVSDIYISISQRAILYLSCLLLKMGVKVHTLTADRVVMRVKLRCRPWRPGHSGSVFRGEMGHAWPYLQVSRGSGFRQWDLYNLPSRDVQPGAHPAVSGACQERRKTDVSPPPWSYLRAASPRPLPGLCTPHPVHAALTRPLQTLPTPRPPSPCKCMAKSGGGFLEEIRSMKSSWPGPPGPRHWAPTPHSVPGLLQLTSTVIGDSEGRR